MTRKELWLRFKAKELEFFDYIKELNKIGPCTLIQTSIPVEVAIELGRIKND